MDSCFSQWAAIIHFGDQIVLDLAKWESLQATSCPSDMSPPFWALNYFLTL